MMEEYKNEYSSSGGKNEQITVSENNEMRASM
jgi:hypothetical protein